MVKIYDGHQKIQLPELTEETHQYPVILSGCHQEIQGQALIERWVELIQKRKYS